MSWLRRDGARKEAEALYAAIVSQARRPEFYAELGAGDLGVGRRVKAMAQALYGRISAYEMGLAGSAEALEAALRRNLFRTAPETGPQPGTLKAVAEYVRGESLGAGALFGPPPSAPGAASAREQGR